MYPFLHESGICAAGISICALAAASTACVSNSEVARGPAVRDSAGIRIVESSFYDVEQLRLVEPAVVRLGDSDADTVELFTDVTKAMRLPGGEIAVVLGDDVVIRVFDSTGAYQHSFLRAGAGPGEMEWVEFAQWVTGDTIFLADRVKQLLLAPDGTPVREVRAPVTWVGGYLTGGTTVNMLPRSKTTTLPPYTIRDYYVRLLRADSSARDSVHLGTHHLRGLPSGRRGNTVFLALGTYATLGSRLFLSNGTSGSSQLFVYDDHLQLQELWRLNEPPRAVDASARARYVDHFRRSATPEQQTMLQEDLQLLAFADSMSAFADVSVGRDGRIWARRAEMPWDDTAQQRWIAFSQSGELQASLQLPATIEVHEFGSDYLLGVVKNDVDVPHVLMFRIEAGGR